MHSHSHNDNERRLFLAMLLTGGFMLAEVIGGLYSGSLALLADAGHMLSDFVTLALSWGVFRISGRKYNIKQSYGYHRFHIIAALVNGLTLFFIAIWMFITAVQRLFQPVEILVGTMTVVAVFGLLANMIVFVILYTGDHENLNMASASLHIMADLLSSVAAIVASLIMLSTGWMRADPLLSAIAALLILKSSISILKKSVHVLLEGTPEKIDPQLIRQTLIEQIAEVIDVHHVHVWSLTGDKPVMTLHAILKQGTDHDQALLDIHNVLRDIFGISHVTAQLEYKQCINSAQ